MKRNLYVWWILASAAGFGSGATVSFVARELVNGLFFVAVGVGMAAGGIAAASLQSVVLRRYSLEVKRWIAINIAGGAATVAIYSTMGFIFDFITGDPRGWAAFGAAFRALFIMVMIAPIAGGVVGVLQWLVLRHYLRSLAQWVFANAAGYGAGWFVSFLGGFLVVILLPRLGDGHLGWASFGAAFGVVYGHLAGSVISKSFGHPRVAGLHRHTC